MDVCLRQGNQSPIITENRKQGLLPIQKARFRSVLRIGKNAGISVLYLRRVTLKGTR